MKQPIEILREDKQYDVPGKSVCWKINRSNKLGLRAIVRNDYTFEPDIDLSKLGNFEQWRISPIDDNYLELNCIWDLRLVQDVMFQTVNNTISLNSRDLS